ncbi:MAG TPA: TadE family protein [Bryobacteraceae bacterium]|nr:TadE family protein [Bryobacteraceae bacterium]
MRHSPRPGRKRLFGPERGTAAVEVALLLPWMVIAFIAVLDFGFSSYALIATQNAARIAATWGAASTANQTALTSSLACGTYALPEFKYAPTPISACGSSLSATPSSGNIGAAGTGAGQIPYVQVAVGYTVGLLAIPGIMPSSITITRTVAMPVR